MDNDLLNALSEILDQKLQPIMNSLSEHTEILRALEDSSHTHKAEIEKINHDTAHIKGDIESIKKSISKSDCHDLNSLIQKINI